MRTVYTPAISHTSNVNVGGSCRTLLRVPVKQPCKSNLRVVNINFSYTEEDGGLTADQLKWFNKGGFISCISEMRLRSSNGEEIDAVRYVPQLWDQLKGVTGSNSFHKDYVTFQNGTQVGYSVADQLGLITNSNNFDTALLNQQEYTLDLLNHFDYLRKVGFVEDGLEIEILWGNNPFEGTYNLQMPQLPVLACDEVLQEHVNIPKTVVFEQIWSDILNIPASTQGVAQVQSIQQRLKAVEGYYCTKLALCVYNSDGTEALPQTAQLINFSNNGVTLISLKGIENTNAASMLSDALGGVPLNVPRCKYLTTYNSEIGLGTSQFENTNSCTPVNTMALAINTRPQNFLMEYRRTIPGVPNDNGQAALSIYIFYWVVREATHDGVSTTVRYL